VSQLDAGITNAGPDGMPPRAQLIAIRREMKRLIADAYKCLGGLHTQLDQAGIRILEYSDLNEVQLRVAANYFTESAFPVLTPLAFDPGRPFPHISNLSLNLAVLIRDAGGDVTVRDYAGTGHAFFNDDRPEVYNPDAAALSWDRTLTFLHERLGLE